MLTTQVPARGTTNIHIDVEDQHPSTQIIVPEKRTGGNLQGSQGVISDHLPGKTILLPQDVPGVL